MVNLLNTLNYEYDISKLEDSIRNHSFSFLSNGRKRGEEDINSHYRKGVVGDWKNYLTEEDNNKFLDRFSKVMELWGYDV